MQAKGAAKRPKKGLTTTPRSSASTPARKDNPPPTTPNELDAEGFKKAVRAHPKVPERLLVRTDQFAAMGPWLRIAAPPAGKRWAPQSSRVVVDGSLVVTGAVSVRDRTSDFGIVVVLGDVECVSLVVGAGWTLICLGEVRAKKDITAQAPNSVTYVGGTVTAPLVKSGSNAWLTLFGGKQSLRATVKGYVMVDGEGPLRSPAR